MKKTPTVTVLIGLPACGKSTWRAQNAGDAFIYSTDDLVELEAARQGKTYGEVWQDYISEATKLANKNLSEAIRERRDVVADRTNLTMGARQKFLAQFPKSYRKVAVYFVLPFDMERLNTRILGRAGKFIPAAVIDKMLADLTTPIYGEGFDEIYTFNSWVD